MCQLEVIKKSINCLLNVTSIFTFFLLVHNFKTRHEWESKEKIIRLLACSYQDFGLLGKTCMSECHDHCHNVHEDLRLHSN